MIKRPNSSRQENSGSVGRRREEIFHERDCFTEEAFKKAIHHHHHHHYHHHHHHQSFYVQCPLHVDLTLRGCPLPFYSVTRGVFICEAEEPHVFTDWLRHLFRGLPLFRCPSTLTRVFWLVHPVFFATYLNHLGRLYRKAVSNSANELILLALHTGVCMVICLCMIQTP